MKKEGRDKFQLHSINSGSVAKAEVNVDIHRDPTPEGDSWCGEWTVVPAEGAWRYCYWGISSSGVSMMLFTGGLGEYEAKINITLQLESCEVPGKG